MNELINFSLDTENAEKNYSLATWYENQGHTAPAHTYYLRAAERSDDEILSYKSLLRASFCYRSQGSRDATEKVLLENALNLLPERPEAYYFLSLLYERNQEWQNCYSYANFGIKCYFSDIEDIDLPEYPGLYVLILQKAISGWWWGKGLESRKLLWELVDEYWNDMDEKHKCVVEDNISRIGSGPRSQDAIFYEKENYSNLRYKFKWSENISANHAQAFQDIFVLTMLNGKKNGTFLEIGASKPFERNNTALLETDFNWSGIAIELNKEFADSYKSMRPNIKVLCENALQIDYSKLLEENFTENVIDYLQLDIEPARNTYECMLKIPFDKYKFAVITYEHDDYIDITRSCKKKSREFLEERGYVLVVNDVSVDGISTFEDWWVHPDLVDQNIINIMKSDFNKITNIGEYFYSKTYYKNPDVKSIEYIPTFTKSKGTSWIVDNFYENPNAVREFALRQKFDEGGIGRGFIGRRTQEQFLFPGLKERFEEIMGRKITAWESYGINGRFQVAWAGEPLVWHCDEQQWGGMLYLTPEAPYQCGTTLYAHKKTRARTYYDKGWDAAWVDIPGDCHLDGTPWEPVDVLGNVFNRLVIFDASCIHSASEYFGTVMENARLWQMFFFDT